MNQLNPFGTGRIGEIIDFLEFKYNVTNIHSLPIGTKLDALCEVLQLSLPEFDLLIANNPPVMRTITGHCFETLFDYIIEHNGHKAIEVGGDGDIDRIVNGVTLQLKTPYTKGTRGNLVQYKTHKTHGAKSESESERYYHSVHDFAEYLVGMISYDPFRVIFIHRDSLPTHPIYTNRIISPFNIDWSSHSGVNDFGLIGIDNIELDSSLYGVTNPSSELLPLSSRKIGLTTEIIVDTILNRSNFRIWDMNMRGFSREFAFRRMLTSKGITVYEPASARPHRADKADLALMSKLGQMHFMQMKGPSVAICRFKGALSVVCTETQLTRGLYNDHATQSRLYLVNDFEYLILAIDPSITQKLQQEIGNTIPLTWTFYAIPSDRLAKYSKHSNRYSPIQRFKYSDLQSFLIDDEWLSNWR